MLKKYLKDRKLKDNKYLNLPEYTGVLFKNMETSIHILENFIIV
jgi:hypothetical protein